MSIENAEILFENHFKIYVLFKDKIVFESELEKKNIKYYCDIENQLNLGSGIRYFINENNRVKVDIIFKENKIIAHTETIMVSDYRDGRKATALYFKVAGIVIGIMILIILFEKMLK
ncbi:hypothetical protein OA93_19585 [Flavobacterium sp. KMS]|uniref:hypothetical protein n=1 Tax=Flavobacterium sp. KMS TaxID=1566023 RepID=UPI00057CDB26|nr:hypothetical protein [Flavobacterium sp. KMS]KIA94690.1 hypothetical protein OA93_19585 [Flavobacterium sp. KMS]